MPEKKNRRKEFLDKFTEELVTTVKEDIAKKEKEKREEERKKREEEIKKLKEKFAKEGVEKILPKGLPMPTLPLPPQQAKPAAPAPVPQIAPKIPAKPPLPAPAPVPPTATPAAVQKPKIAKIEAPKVLPPIAPGEIDFGKIVFLVKDPLITYIECPGPGKNIVIRKAGNTLATQITLTKDEIIKIIKSFSEKTKIPLVEGMLIARSENMEISAVVSEIIPPSFIIKKDIIPPIKAPPSKLLPPTQPYIAPGPVKPPRIPMPGTAMPLTPPPLIVPRIPALPAKPEEKEGIFKKKIKIGK